MNNYSPEVLRTLLGGGWQEGRAADTKSIEQFVKSDGFAWFPAVEAFLKEFAGLSFVYAESPGFDRDFTFDAVLSAESFAPSWILEHYRSRIPKHTAFCPIGVLSGSHMQLFMDSEACFYGGYDDFLVFFGTGTAEFFQSLCSPYRAVQMD
jgi:hypothetical protein